MLFPCGQRMPTTLLACPTISAFWHYGGDCESPCLQKNCGEYPQRQNLGKALSKFLILKFFLRDYPAKEPLHDPRRARRGLCAKETQSTNAKARLDSLPALETKHIAREAAARDGFGPKKVSAAPVGLRVPLGTRCAKQARHPFRFDFQRAWRRLCRASLSRSKCIKKEGLQRPSSETTIGRNVTFRSCRCGRRFLC